MLRLTFASLRARPLRALLTALSIVLGVAMISGTFVLTGQIDRAFSEIFDAVNAKNDVVDRAAHRRARTTPTSFPEPFPASVLTHGAEGAGRRGGDGRDRRARIARHVQERHAQDASARPAALRRSCSRPSPPRFEPGTFVARPRRAHDRRDRAARGHGRQGRRQDRHEVGLVTLDGLKRLRVVGIYKIGTEASLGGALVSSIPLADAQRWYGFENQFTQVNLQAEPGVSHAELRDRVRARRRQPLQGADRRREGEGRLEGDLRPHQRLPRARAAGVRRRRRARRRLPDLQHVLDHGRAAHPRDRDAAHARREPQADPHERDARGAS